MKFLSSSPCFSLASNAFSAILPTMSPLRVPSGLRNCRGFAFAQLTGSQMSSSSSGSAMYTNCVSLLTAPLSICLQKR